MNEKLLKTTQKVAELCHLLGYRGCISVDTVETNDGEIAVTEVNCRYIISTPMYEVSEAIGGYRRLSEAVGGYRRLSEAIGGYEGHAVSQFTTQTGSFRCVDHLESQLFDRILGRTSRSRPPMRDEVWQQWQRLVRRSQDY